MGDLDLLISEFDVKVRCRACEEQFSQRIGWLRHHPIFYCQECGAALTVPIEQLERAAIHAGDSLLHRERHWADVDRFVSA